MSVFYPIARSYGNMSIQMFLSDRSIIWKPGHTNVCILSDRSIISKPGHTNVCILSDRSIISKPGHTNVCILSDSNRSPNTVSCDCALDSGDHIATSLYEAAELRRAGSGNLHVTRDTEQILLNASSHFSKRY